MQNNTEFAFFILQQITFRMPTKVENYWSDWNESKADPSIHTSYSI